MSSTARGGKRSDADFYATPAWPVDRLFDRLALPLAKGGEPCHWIEPAAGEGAIIKATHNYLRNRAKKPRWTAIELRKETYADLVPLVGQSTEEGLYTGYDFLNGDFADLRGDVCITNPPFSIAMEFIQATLPLATWVIHLLRLNFLGTEDRNEFFKSNMPDVYVIPDRVSFALSISCGNKNCDWGTILSLSAEPIRKCPDCGAKTKISSTDSIEYAWFVFGPERGRRSGKIEVLDHTPLEMRKKK